MSNHLVERVPETVHQLLTEMLIEGAHAGLAGNATVEVTRQITLYQNEPTVHAELGIELKLKIRER